VTLTIHQIKCHKFAFIFQWVNSYQVNSRWSVDGYSSNGDGSFIPTEQSEIEIFDEIDWSWLKFTHKPLDWTSSLQSNLQSLLCSHTRRIPDMKQCFFGSHLYVQPVNQWTCQHFQQKQLSTSYLVGWCAKEQPLPSRTGRITRR